MWQHWVHHRKTKLAACAALALGAMIVGGAGQLACARVSPRRKPTAKAPHVPLPRWVDNTTAAIFKNVEHTGHFSKAASAAQKLEEQVTLYARVRQARAFAQAAFAQRLLLDVGAARHGARRGLLKYLLAHRPLAQSFAFFDMPGRPNSGKAANVLNMLRRKRPAMVNRFASLVTAISVVQATPYALQVNENRTVSPRPLALFDFYSKNAGRMVYGIKRVPPELLAYVVDATASIHDLTWALNRYAHQTNLGKIYFSVRYDYHNLAHGGEKKVDRMGYNLPNILKYGGICADQAYFASTVGKAIGMPTAYDTARAGDFGHAWIGFLEDRGGQGVWNFEAGRYSEYQGIRGVVQQPVYRVNVSDNSVSLTAELIHTTAQRRQESMAFRDAAALLTGMMRKSQSVKSIARPPCSGEYLRRKARRPNVADVLHLVKTSLALCPGTTESWLIVRQLARQGKMTFREKRTWSALLMRYCGRRYPYFAFDTLEPMVRTIANSRQQSKFWDRAFTMFESHPDIAASVRMLQAHLWSKHDHPNKAGQFYMDVVTRFANAGPFAITALEHCGAMLQRVHKAKKIPEFYGQIWHTMHRPQGAANTFVTSSNWYRAGRMYASALSKSGHGQQATAVLATLAK